MIGWFIDHQFWCSHFWFRCAWWYLSRLNDWNQLIGYFNHLSDYQCSVCRLHDQLSIKIIYWLLFTWSSVLIVEWFSRDRYQWSVYCKFNRYWISLISTWSWSIDDYQFQLFFKHYLESDNQCEFFKISIDLVQSINQMHQFNWHAIIDFKSLFTDFKSTITFESLIMIHENRSNDANHLVISRYKQKTVKLVNTLGNLDTWLSSVPPLTQYRILANIWTVVSRYSPLGDFSGKRV